VITGKYARLRRLDVSDADYVRLLRNSPPIISNFVYRNFTTDIQQQRWIESLSTDATQLYFVAEEMQTGAAFGVYHLKAIDHRNQHAELGFFLDESGRGRGELAFEAAFLLLDYGFGYLNLQKISGEVLPDNTRAMRFDEGLGLRLEATRRRHVFYDGEFHDLLLYSIFREDFYERPSPLLRPFHKQRAECESGEPSPKRPSAR
jgi:RimJ/RimL family protein N-acetyltransferase